jgi:hypothetical protein
MNLQTKQVHISDLCDAELDWAVAYVEGHTADPYTWLFEATVEDVADSNGFRPSTDWSQGGPRIEREGITVEYLYASRWIARHPTARHHSPHIFNEGPTPLIAAMRCLVASKLGQDTITLITSV